jgi:ABC-type nitrate/sulfonate/bicarbonate transport systems, periplasmic components
VPVFFGAANGADVVLLAGGRGSPTGQSRILVKNGSPITTVADLRGKEIAMPLYTVPHYPLSVALDRAGLAWSDVQAVNLNTTDGLTAFNSGNVDAFVIWDPNAAVVETQHDGRTLQELGYVVNPASAFYARAAAVGDPAKKAALEDLTRETINAQAGVGYLITQAREVYRTDIIIVGLIVYALLGLAADAIVRALERWLLVWRLAFTGT